MNSLSTFATLFILGAVAIVNVAGLPSQGTSSANAIEDGYPRGGSPPSCAHSEVYSRCGANPMCQKTCDNHRGPIACTRSDIVANVCYPGCVCKDGFVRVVQGDQCIPIDKCEGRVRH